MNRQRTSYDAVLREAPPAFGRNGRGALSRAVLLAALLATMTLAHASDGPVEWSAQLTSASDVGNWTKIGVGGRNANTGYTGQSALDVASFSGLGFALYRQGAVDGWTGPTGFYAWEFKPSMPAGGQTTWTDIYLWAQNYTPRLGDRTWIGMYGVPPYEFPSWYNALLVLDYVPTSLNWDGPTSFDIRSLASPMYLPVPQVTDPLQGTRMHLTVYAGPIPEPSSLAALGLALTAMLSLSKHGAFVRRRRR